MPTRSSMSVTKRGCRGPTRTSSRLPPSHWDQCEKAARDLGRYRKEHPEGWRVVVVTYSGGLCEFFPHWGEGAYRDYSSAFLAGFREWLTTRYSTDAKLRAAWKNEKATLDKAEPPAPAERLKGDCFDFYDPTKGTQTNRLLFVLRRGHDGTHHAPGQGAEGGFGRPVLHPPHGRLPAERTQLSFRHRSPCRFRQGP